MAESETRRGFLKTAGVGIIAAAIQGATPLAPPDKQPPHLNIPKKDDHKVGYAIVGLGELALGQIMPAFKVAHQSKPVALVSGHPDKARQVADAYGMDPKKIYSYDNYDEMKNDPDIEAVYIVLPNSMHAEYTNRAFAAGKHVLCEKPMSVTVDEAKSMIDAGKKADRKLMIAYRLHYEPYNRWVIDTCKKKEFGQILMIESANAQNVSAPNIRLSKTLGGGPVGDIGVYCINACRYITQEEPVEVTAQAFRPTDDPRFAEVDRDVVFTLKFPSGAVASCGISFSSASSRRYRVHCTGGLIEMDPAFDYEGLRLYTEKGNEKTEHKLYRVQQFAAEMDHFASCIRENKEPLTPGEEGVADMKVVVAIHEAAESGKTVKIA